MSVTIRFSSSVAARDFLVRPGQPELSAPENVGPFFDVETDDSGEKGRGGRRNQ